MNIIRKDSPNVNDRKNGMRPSLLILHYTGTETAAEADAIYMTPGLVSPHYMIDRDGAVIQYVDETERAWHAGRSSWDGHDDINSASIGIEIVNGGHERGLEEFPARQIDALVELINDIRSRWYIRDHRVLGHSDIAPGRKIDPGERFPWAALCAAGIGLMPSPVKEQGGDIALMLKKYGYDYTDDVALLKKEFCRHYLPDKMDVAADGGADNEIAPALQSLLNQKLTLS